MASPLIPVLIAAATAAVGYFFQENSAKNARIRKRIDAEREENIRVRDFELERAQATLDKLSSTLDVQYYYAAHGAMFAAVRKARGDQSRKDKDAETWGGYEQAVLEWITNKNSLSAHVEQYFGPDNHKLLLEIEDAFHRAGTLIAATYYGSDETVVKDGVEDLTQFNGILKPLDDKLKRLNKLMITDIQNQNVGRLRA